MVPLPLRERSGEGSNQQTEKEKPNPLQKMSIILLFLALFFGARFLYAFANIRNTREQREGEYARHYRVIEFDKSNAGSHAHLAEMLFADGQVSDAIGMWRAAIRALPHGHATEKWKRDLKRALEVQSYIDRGQRPPGFHDLRACHKCELLIPATAKICPHCGATISMSVTEFFGQKEVQRDWMRETLVIAVVLYVAALLFSTLPAEIKGVLLVSTALVGGWLLVRAIGGGN